MNPQLPASVVIELTSHSQCFNCLLCANIWPLVVKSSLPVETYLHLPSLRSFSEISEVVCVSERKNCGNLPAILTSLSTMYCPKKLWSVQFPSLLIFSVKYQVRAKPDWDIHTSPLIQFQLTTLPTSKRNSHLNGVLKIPVIPRPQVFTVMSWLYK